MKKNQLMAFPTGRSLTKLWRIMRLTIFLLCISAITTLADNSYAQSTRLNIQVNNGTVKEALNYIENNSDFVFLYNAEDLNVNKRVEVDLKNASISQILNEVLRGQDVSYEIYQRQIVIHKRDASGNPATQGTSKTIVGKVTDSSGGPIPGVTVVVKGTNNGTITDVNGNYTLKVSSTAQTLVFSFVGMKTQEIAIAGKSTINVSMKEETVGLQEVVAVGYGVQKKSNVTGSIVSVGENDLKNRSTDNLGKALQGKVAGVQVLTLSGAPGTSPKFRVRGYSSNSSSDPLYIVDGLKVKDIGYLDPNSIKSVEVLKDAASAAIYGAEAGNGVVLITTMTGEAQKSRFFYDGSYSIQSQAHKMNMMSASQFKDYWMQSGQPESAFENGNTDWNKVIFGNGMRQSHTIGFEGGTKKASFYASLTYSSNNGMVVGNNDIDKRIASQVNASYKVNQWLKVGTTNSIERGKTVSVSANDATASGSVIGGAYFYDPTVPVYYKSDADYQANDPQNSLGLLSAEAEGYNVLRNSAGKLYGSSLLMQSNLWNPIGMIKNYTNDSWRSNINGTMYADITPIKGLVYTSRIGYRFGNLYTSNYVDGHYWNNNQNTTNGALTASLSNNVYIQWENFANYNFSVGENDFTAMAGMKYSNNNNTYVNGNTSLLYNDAANYRYLDYSTPSATDNVGGNNINTRTLSYFGRLSWNYKGKYILQGSFRADAFDASKLSRQSRWGYFPAVSGGWVISNEKFFQNLGFTALSNFKLRASWGINGNVDVLQNYPYATSLVLGDGYYNFNNKLVAGAAPPEIMPNPTLKWERSEQTNFGFDSRFFDDRLSFSLDYYKKLTNGLLNTNSPTPAITGTSTMSANLGKIENSGFEMDLSFKGKIGGLKYNISGNLATLHNEVLDSPYGTGRFGGGGGFLTDATYFEKGYPIWYIRTYQIDHIDKTTGQPIYKTAQQLGTDDGKAYSGSAIPKFTYGITVSGELKSFDLRIFGTGQQGSKLFLGVIRPDLPIMNLPEFVYRDHWTPTHTTATKPSSTVFQSFPSASTYASSNDWVFNSSFFKIKEIQLGYTLPSRMTNRIKISSLRVYTSFDGFFVFTKYPGLDPESMSGTQNGQTVTIPGGPTLSLGGGMGVDRIQYPAMKQVVFGINVSF